MIHFLRAEGNKTVVDVEVIWPSGEHGDIRVLIVIEEYSRLLLNILSTHPVEVPKYIKDFMALQELRGEWHESPLADKEYGPDEFVERRVKEVAMRWNLQYVVD